MPSRNTGVKRQRTSDSEIPAELARREAQDRPAGSQAESPVDALHVDAPKQQENTRGHRRQKKR